MRKKFKNSIYPLLLFLIFTDCSQYSVTSEYLFKPVGKEVSGIAFENNISEDEIHNILNYIYFYNGGGVAVGDVDNNGFPDIFFVSNQGENKLYLNKGGLAFEDVTAKAGIEHISSWNTGVSMVDINADGLLDIYVCSVSGLLDFKGRNELYVNNGDGTFREEAREYGLDYQGYSTQAYFFDYDKDDDLDVYIVNQAVHTTLSYGPASVRKNRVPKVGDVLLKNVGGKFVDMSQEAGIYGGQNGYGLSASIADFNNDGWDDIYVCNDFHEDDYYYINNKNGSFEEHLNQNFSTIGRFSMGSDAADVNNDGFLDLMTLDMLPRDEHVLKESEGDDAMYNIKNRLDKLGYRDQFSRNMLQLNMNGQYFTEMGIYNGVADTDWSWGPLFADFDNDGKKDLYITTGILRRPNNLDFRQYVSSTLGNLQQGNRWLYKALTEMPPGKYPNQIFKNDGGRFQTMNSHWIPDEASLSNGAAYTDLDLDGDLDLVVNELNGTSYIMENLIDSGESMTIELKYKGNNLEGIGSKVELYVNGNLQVKSLYRTRGFMSAVDNKLHFGLGVHQSIDSLRIIWPDLKSQTILAPATENKLVIDYSPDQITIPVDPSTHKKPYFKKSELIQYTHQEDDFDEFIEERLNHYRLSTLGPVFDVSDVDDNGFQDILIGGSSGKKAILLMNNGHAFYSGKIPGIENDSLYEDTVIHFFDADGDGDEDLFMGSGLSTLGTEFLQNRIYLNDQGVFTRSKLKIQTELFNTKCVLSSDYDSDGDLDLFVGNISVKNEFGSAVPSFLLNNDGSGNFSVNPAFQCHGMVTDAIWEDVNKDGWEDLIVVAHGDAPKIFINKRGTLEEQKAVRKLNGMWQCVTMFDIDADGDRDIMMGNWGLNTKFSLYSGTPRMYFNDFNRDGTSEAIWAYSRNGKWYPFNSKDELSAQMKIISKRFTSYKEFAGKSVEKILGEELINESKVYQIDELASGYLRNDNGIFESFVPFGPSLQTAPINSFSKVEIKEEAYLLVTGNLLNVNTYHGGYSSLKGFFLNRHGKVEPASNFGLDPFSTEIRSTGSLEMMSGELLLLFSNQSEMKSYRYGEN